MPHWIIFHPEGTFEDEQSKRALSQSITTNYTRPEVNMPAFYVVVNFIKTQPEDQWVGGQKVTEWSKKPFIRIQASHIHVRMPQDPKVYKSQMARLNGLLKPHIQDKGYDFELHIVETERQLWTINALPPPELRSEDEKVWRAENRAVPDEEMEDMRRKHKL